MRSQNSHILIEQYKVLIINLYRLNKQQVYLVIRNKETLQFALSTADYSLSLNFSE